MDTDGDGKADDNKTNTDKENDGIVDLNIDVDGDGYPDINIDVNGDGIPDLNIDTDENKNLDIVNNNKGTKTNTQTEPLVDALVTINAANNIDFVVTPDQMSRAIVGNSEYYEIISSTEKTTVNLKSRGDITECKYDVKYTLTENTFKNIYRKADGTTGTLNNQLILRLNGYSMQNGKIVPNVYNIDVNSIENNEFIIKDIVIKNDVNANISTVQSWDINMVFRNYRDYDQIDNSNKISNGHIEFNVKECKRIS